MPGFDDLAPRESAMTSGGPETIRWGPGNYGVRITGQRRKLEPDRVFSEANEGEPCDRGESMGGENGTTTIDEPWLRTRTYAEGISLEVLTLMAGNLLTTEGGNNSFTHKKPLKLRWT